MGTVAARIRVMPESTDINLNDLKQSIKAAVPSAAKLHAMEELPIAFGLKALIVVVLLDDKAGGGTTEVENAFSKVKGVESINVEEVGLI
ncbi:MAG: Elongation factor 1-beta [Methanosaeta sp. PtaB.Bin039]|nr:MAG: Elongation factor 1-beta [Methanosaeta sp. PtaB.Bin039]HOT07780.1 elongation factor 1-beta [Methanotrichaceae archaeon]HQF16093.1 elongation factor 1-beta [Methanotrichaceae archaeon]HQI90791.1 elongation factor 1-beta [Methanotrichaceae archaeon]HQJ28252.1 elongation factor 1-beta [Methanotrichaceae archaeon]